MIPGWAEFASRHDGRAAFGFLVGLTIALFAVMPQYNVVDYDTAFLTWLANEVMGPAVFGRDVMEINPPLAFMLYVPAVLLSHLAGFEWGVRIWVLFLTLLSISCLWQTAPRPLRMPIALVLVLFAALAFPNHYAQREQIVLLLCAPYVAGIAPNRRWGVLIGLMAATGFMMKPHFLIPLAFVFALRRRIGTEEIVIALCGLLYALTVAVFFQAYLFEMIPATVATYWAIYFPREVLVGQVAYVLLSALPLALAGDRQPAARPFAAATFGFTAAALLQQKGFVYHFIPAFGFLALFLTVRTYNTSRIVAAVAAFLLLAEAAMIVRSWHYWSSFYADLATERAGIKQEIDKAGSYISFVPEPYPAFPAAIHTPSRFLGTAIHQIFIPAVARFDTGYAAGDPTKANHLALSQALTELGRKPNLVIVMNFPYAVDDRPFDILAWYQRDPAFREAWKNYEAYSVIGNYRLYRRK